MRGLLKKRLRFSDRSEWRDISCLRDTTEEVSKPKIENSGLDSLDSKSKSIQAEANEFRS